MDIHLLLEKALEYPIGSFQRDHLCVQAVREILDDKVNLDRLIDKNHITRIVEINSDVGYAISGHTLDFAKAFINLVKIKNSRYPKFLNCVIKRGNIELAKFLIEDWWESINQITRDGTTLLDTACTGQHLEMVKWLINNNIVLPTTPEYELTFGTEIKNSGINITDYLFLIENFELLDLLLVKNFKFSAHHLGRISSYNQFAQALDWWIANKISLDDCLKNIFINGSLPNTKLFIEKTGYVPTDSDYDFITPKNKTTYLVSIRKQNKAKKAIKKRELVATKLLDFMEMLGINTYDRNNSTQKRAYDALFDILTELDN